MFILSLKGYYLVGKIYTWVETFTPGWKRLYPAGKVHTQVERFIPRWKGLYLVWNIYTQVHLYPGRNARQLLRTIKWKFTYSWYKSQLLLVHIQLNLYDKLVVCVSSFPLLFFVQIQTYSRTLGQRSLHGSQTSTCEWTSVNLLVSSTSSLKHWSSHRKNIGRKQGTKWSQC